MRAGRLALGLAFVMVLVGGPACSSPPPPPPPPPPGPPVLQPRETFDWTGEKISFSIPPAGWRREGETSGGIKGARFIKERSVGEAIGLGDYYILADRNRSFSLGEAIDLVEFKPERRQNPEWYRMIGRREATVAGEPAVIVDYTVKVPERPHTYSAREVYFVHNSHMFICTFIGLPETMAVFEAVLASIQFPG